jgi:peptidoglycan/xylan/chitin deacetylase (PgdA/CDA1 family)
MDRLERYGKAVPADAPLTEEGRDRIAITFDDGFSSVAENALPVMASRNIPAALFVPTGYLGARAGWITKREHENYQEQVLSERQLRELPAPAVCIGSHTDLHRDLSRVSTGEARTELGRSRAALEAMLHRQVKLLALPYGGWDPVVLALARQAGYERIFLNVPLAASRDAWRDVVGRTNTSPDDWGIEFALKARGAYQWLPAAMKVKRMIRQWVAGTPHERPRRMPERRERSTPEWTDR